jgi:hypothetical protein
VCSLGWSVGGSVLLDVMVGFKDNGDIVVFDKFES